MQELDTARSTAEQLVNNVKKVMVGKDSAIELGVVALLCQGHALIEDVPGVGKTMLARSIARSTGCAFKRIQFTPDLLPTDITGVSIFNQKTGEFEQCWVRSKLRRQSNFASQIHLVQSPTGEEHMNYSGVCVSLHFSSNIGLIHPCVPCRDFRLLSRPMASGFWHP